MPTSRFWGFWTRGKLELLRSYLGAFTRASKRSHQRVYLDLFAGGTGGQERWTGLPVEGSPRVALSINRPPFTILRFFEQEPTSSQLRDSLSSDFRDRDFAVVAGDCNETIVSALDELKRYDRAATFAFLDPDGPHYRWSTIEALAAFKRVRMPKTELFILFPAPMFIRLLPKDGSVTQRAREQLTGMYGTDLWERIYRARVEGSLRPSEAREEYVNLMRWRLERDLDYRWSHPLEVRNTRNVPLYYLIFATDHEVGNRIMSDVYNAASRDLRSCETMYSNSASLRKRRTWAL